MIDTIDYPETEDYRVRAYEDYAETYEISEKNKYTLGIEKQEDTKNIDLKKVTVRLCA